MSPTQGCVELRLSRWDGLSSASSSLLSAKSQYCSTKAGCRARSHCAVHSSVASGASGWDSCCVFPSGPSGVASPMGDGSCRPVTLDVGGVA
eukprot:12408771-Karenia_brevis.AAC.1